MQRSTPKFRLVAAALVASSLLLAACGTSDGSGATATTAKTDKTTTTAKDGGDTTTTEADDDTTTTEGGTDPVDGPTLDDLAEILPAASDLGPGWSVAPADEDDGDNALGDAIEEQCPAASSFGGDEEDDEEERAEVSFDSDLFQTVKVSLSASAEPLDAEELTAAVEAINSCGEITSTNESNGLETSVTFTADEVADYGDQGVALKGDVRLTAPELGDPVEFSLYILSFRDGTVGVTVTGTDGIDETTLTVNALDTDATLVSLADAVGAAVGQLTD